MDVDACAKTKGGKKGRKAKDKESDGNCFWCGAHGHVMKDCRKKAAQRPSRQELLNQKPRAKAKARRERRPSRNGQMREKYDRRDWQAWERIQKQARQQWESFKAGNLGANSVDYDMGERIDLTIDSACATCASPVGVASAVGSRS